MAEKKDQKVLWVPPLIGTKVEIIVAHFGGTKEDHAIVRGLLRGLIEESYLSGTMNGWEVDQGGILSCNYCATPAEVECQDCHKALCQKHRNVIMYKNDKETKVLCNACLPAQFN